MFIAGKAVNLRAPTERHLHKIYGAPLEREVSDASYAINITLLRSGCNSSSLLNSSFVEAERDEKSLALLS